jgi:hypothetical protein
MSCRTYAKSLDGEHNGHEMERLEASIAQVQSDSAPGAL